MYPGVHSPPKGIIMSEETRKSGILHTKALAVMIDLMMKMKGARAESKNGKVFPGRCKLWISKG